MHILHARAAPSKSAAHNPDVCGINPTTDCNECQESRVRAERDFYERDAEARAEQHALAIVQQELHLSNRALARLLPALGRLLLPHQAEGTAEIVGAVLDEREATP